MHSKHPELADRSVRELQSLHQDLHRELGRRFTMHGMDGENITCVRDYDTGIFHLSMYEQHYSCVFTVRMAPWQAEHLADTIRFQLM